MLLVYSDLPASRFFLLFGTWPRFDPALPCLPTPPAGTKATELMWELKELFDPEHILNPGVILNKDPLVRHGVGRGGRLPSAARTMCRLHILRSMASKFYGADNSGALQPRTDCGLILLCRFM